MAWLLARTRTLANLCGPAMGLMKRFYLLLGVLALPRSQAGDGQTGVAPESFDFDIMIRTQQLRDLGVSTRPLWATEGQGGANGSMVMSGNSNDTTDGVGLSLTVSQKRLVGLVRGVPVKPMAGDGLVALNGLSLLSWAEVQGSATHAAQHRQGFKGVLPLTLTDDGGEEGGTQGGVLVGFLRVELLDSGTLTFRPQDPLRRGALVKEVLEREEADAQAKALQEKERQDKAQKLREQQLESERRRRLLEVAEEEERVRRVEEAQQAHKEEARHAGLRKEGRPFLYVASFHKPGALGLTFDMTVRDRSVVMGVEPNSAAAAQKVQVGDVLVVVNEANVTAMPPQHALQVLSRSTWPRWLTFSVPGTQPSSTTTITATQAAQADGVSLNATVVVHWPEVLQGSYPAYLAPWSISHNTATTPPAPLPPQGSTSESENGTTNATTATGVATAPPLFCAAAGGERNGSGGSCVNAQSLLHATDRVGCAKYPEGWGKSEGGAGAGASWVALVRRGECTFVDKARRVQEAGGVGVVVVNVKESLAHMPAGQLFTEDVHTPTAMVGSAVGHLLLLASSWQPAPPPSDGASGTQSPGSGVWVELLPYALPPPPPAPAPTPPPLQTSKGRQKPAPPTRKRGLVEETPKVPTGPRMREEMEQGGRLLLQADKGYSEDFDFLSALFGARTARVAGQVIIPDPKYGCDARTYKTRVAGAIVAVERGGGCAFSDKALAAQAGGALGVIIMNNKPDEPLMRLMAAPEEADKVKLPVYMASDKFRMELLYLQRFGRAESLIASLSEEKQWTAYD